MNLYSCSRIRHFVVTAMTVALGFSSAHAQSNSNYTLQIDQKSGRIIGVVNSAVTRTAALKGRTAISTSSLEYNSRKIQVADKYLWELGAYFGLNNVTGELTPRIIKEAVPGITSVHYSQQVGGIPVLGGSLIVHINENDELIDIRGKLISGVKSSNLARINAKRAIAIAKQNMETRYRLKESVTSERQKLVKLCRSKSKRGKLTHAACIQEKLTEFKNVSQLTATGLPKLHLYNETALKEGSGGTAVPAWVLTMANTRGDGEEFVIDAQTGAVLFFAEAKLRADSGTERDNVYDCSLGCACRTNFPFQGYIWGRSGIGAPPRGPNPIYGGTDVDDAYDMLDTLRNFYIDRLGRYAANNLGGMSYLTSNSDESRAYTHYDGCSTSTCVNGNAWLAYTPTPSFAFCAGSPSIDVYGHEYFHAFAYSELLGSATPGTFVFHEGEAGAIGEGVADLFGEDFEGFVLGESAIDWKSATNSNLKEKRNIVNPADSIGPTGNPQALPDYYNSSNYYCGPPDVNFNVKFVHRNSTVISRMLYLASVGGDFNGCTIQGIGRDKVVHIAAHAVTSYFVPTETYSMAYNSFMGACHDLAANPDQLTTLTPAVVITEADCNNFEIAMQSMHLDQAGGCVGDVPANYQVPATCVPPPPSVDYDQNGTVDLWDYNALRKAWGQEGSGLPEDGDLSGKVDAPDYQLISDALSLPNMPPMPTIKGDYDFDGDVDGGDFLEWQRHFGESGPGLLCDGNVDGSVDSADYTIWRDNFGNTIN